MPKRIVAKVKLHIPAGKANPAPPVGPSLSQHGVSIMDFCNTFNEKTKDKGETILPVIITIYQDRTFNFIIKSPLASVLLKKAAGVEKGSGIAGKEKVAKVTKAQVKEIAEKKMADLNASDIAKAVKIIEGTAKSMGIDVEK